MAADRELGGEEGEPPPHRVAGARLSSSVVLRCVLGSVRFGSTGVGSTEPI